MVVRYRLYSSFRYGFLLFLFLLKLRQQLLHACFLVCIATDRNFCIFIFFHECNQSINFTFFRASDYCRIDFEENVLCHWFNFFFHRNRSRCRSRFFFFLYRSRCRSWIIIYWFGFLISLSELDGKST